MAQLIIINTLFKQLNLSKNFILTVSVTKSEITPESTFACNCCKKRRQTLLVAAEFT